MHEYRFYTPPEMVRQGKALIAGHEAHHLKNVLRMKKGDKVLIFDGISMEYEGVLVSLSRNEVVVENLQTVREAKSGIPGINLYIALTGKFDFIIEKSTELGVNRIIPIITEKSTVKIKPEAQNNKLDRWKRIAIASCMQCGRISLPIIMPAIPFSEAVTNCRTDGIMMIASLSESPRPLLKVLTDTFSKQTDISILIGPPGDFTSAETSLAEKNGAIPFSLGEHTLRTETAAIATLAITGAFFYSQVF